MLRQLGRMTMQVIGNAAFGAAPSSYSHVCATYNNVIVDAVTVAVAKSPLHSLHCVVTLARSLLQPLHSRSCTTCSDVICYAVIISQSTLHSQYRVFTVATSAQWPLHYLEYCPLLLLMYVGAHSFVPSRQWRIYSCAWQLILIDHIAIACADDVGLAELIMSHNQVYACDTG